MKKLLCLAAVAAVGLPASALAAGPPSHATDNPAKVCKAKRTAAGDSAAFTALIVSENPGAKVTARNAYGKCVSAAARKDAEQRKTAKTNAAKQCKAEGLKGRAFGTCVSTKAKAKKAAADQAELAKARARGNAAKQCKAETPALKGRAFGQCVSTKAKAQNDDKPAPPAQS